MTLERSARAKILADDVEVTIIPSLLVSEAATELLQTRGLRVQQGLVRPTEPDEEAENGDDDGQRHPELDLVLDQCCHK